jgi:hypothetical protein
VLLALAQERRDALVERSHALAGVDDKEDDAGRLDREADLLFRSLGDRRRGVAAGQAKATGVEQGEFAVVNLRRDDVARDARHVVNNGYALPGQPVEQAALAHIGAAYDGDGARSGNHWSETFGPRRPGGKRYLDGAVLRFFG